MKNTEQTPSLTQQTVKLSPLLVNVEELLGDDSGVKMAKMVYCIGESVVNGVFPTAVGVLAAASADEADPVLTGFLLAPVMCQIAGSCRQTAIYQELKDSPQLKLWEEQMIGIDSEMPELAVVGFLKALSDYTRMLRDEGSKNVLNALMLMVAVNLPAVQSAAEALMNEHNTPDRFKRMNGSGVIKFVRDVIPVVVTDYPALFKVSPNTSVTKLFSLEYMSKMDDALALSLQISDLVAKEKICVKCAFDESGLTDRLIELCDMAVKQKSGEQLLSMASELPPPPAGDEAKDCWRDGWLLMAVRQGLYNGIVKGKHNPNYAFQAVVKIDPLSVITLSLLGIRDLMAKSDCNCKRGVELLTESEYVRPTK